MAATTTNPSEAGSTLLRPQERVLSTLEADGSRRWLYPRLSKGRFWNARRGVAFTLIAIFVLLPYVSINGKPAILLDAVRRHFTLFGFTFLPTDEFLLALFMISTFLGIFFLTAMFGRVWCGWACPQTVYMEFLFRPIERLCTGRIGAGGPPRARSAAFGGILRYGLNLVACLFIAHTFLAYFVGVASLRHWVTQSPLEHPASFVIMAATTGLMMFNFCWFREQTCMIACPYGRFQSVMLDRDSLIIGYDRTRGEPRTPVHRALPQLNSADKPAGDCIDCTMCVQVCPTGIDIRDGLQFECVNCAQCIDACDAVMDRIHRPRGLIRYESQATLAGEKHRLLRPRVAIYLTIWIGIVSLLAFLIITKSPFDMVAMRNLGRPFFVADDGNIVNDFRVKLTDRSDKPQTFHIFIADRPDIHLKGLESELQLAPGEMRTEPVQIEAPGAAFKGAGVLDITLRAENNDGAILDQHCKLLGPYGVPASGAIQ